MNRVIHRNEGVVVQPAAQACLAPEDGERLKRLLVAAGRRHGRLVIDCSRVEMVAAAFLSSILSAYRQLGARPGDFVLCGLGPTARQVFAVTQLDRFFPICGTVEEALRAPWPEPSPTVVPGRWAQM